MVRKCRGVAEIAVMEVDLRTTRPPPDLDDVPPSANKRKIAAETNFEFSTTTTSFVKLRSRRRRVVLPENSVPAPPAENTLLLPGTTSTKEKSSISPTSDDDASTFACSSNGCSEIVEESKFVDLEVTIFCLFLWLLKFLMFFIWFVSECCVFILFFCRMRKMNTDSRTNPAEKGY